MPETPSVGRICSAKDCPFNRAPQPLENFHRRNLVPGGYSYMCRTCDRERQKTYRARIKAKNLGQKPPTATPPAPPPADEFEIIEAVAAAIEVPTQLIWDPNGTPERSTPPPAPAPPAPPTPLETAMKARAEAAAKRDLKREHAAVLEENERLQQTISQLVEMKKAPNILVYQKPSWERSDAIACAAASDWHVEEEVVAAAVHGLNEYNLEIARGRGMRFFQNFLHLANMMARESTIRTIHISFLGDFFSNWIHEELLASTLLAPGEAARFCLEIFFAGIDFLLRESAFVIEGDLIPGNHGRMTDHMHFSNPTGTSLETFMYHALAARYAGNDRVRLRVAEHAMVYRKFFERFTMRLIHGYEVKYGGGVGGLTIPLNKAIAQWDIAVRTDLTVLGHFHQRFDGGNFLANGSLIGYNTYAQAIKAKYEEAQQSFWLIHARNGGTKATTAPIWVTPAKEQSCADMSAPAHSPSP